MNTLFLASLFFIDSFLFVTFSRSSPANFVSNLDFYLYPQSNPSFVLFTFYFLLCSFVYRHLGQIVLFIGI